MMMMMMVICISMMVALQFANAVCIMHARMPCVFYFCVKKNSRSE